MRPTFPPSRTPGPAPHARRRAFTLIELLVVIAILSLVVGLSFPYLRSMIRSSSEQMAANSVANSVIAARSFAVRYKPFTNSPRDSSRTSEDDGDGYSGAAVIVTPANELRVVENDETAERGLSGVRMELPPAGDVIRNGYKHIEGLNDLLLPKRVAILGIQRTADNEIELLPPPFAISFNRRGEMIVRNSVESGVDTDDLERQRRSDGFVYYAGSGIAFDRFVLPDDDSNGNGSRDAGEGSLAFAYSSLSRNNFASNGYGPVNGVTSDNLRLLTDFSRGAAPLIPDGPAVGRRALPWDRLETVVGVVIFNPDNLPEAWVIPDDQDPNTTTSTYAGRWHPDRARAVVCDVPDADTPSLLRWVNQAGNGVVLFFNRHTGNDLNR